MSRTSGGGVSSQRGRVVRGRQEVRITGGRLRSRRIRFAAAEDLRPTPDRVRETLFNWLGQNLAGRQVLDLFAGSGILGIEAWSRGAAWVGFVERSARVATTLRQNLDELEIPAGEWALWTMDAQSWLQKAGSEPAGLTGCPEGLVDLVLIDPPFARPELVEQALEILATASWLDPEADIYVEYGSSLTEERLQACLDRTGWVGRKEGQAGESRFRLLCRAAPDGVA